MENLGALSILLAFCLSLFAVAASLAGKYGRRPFLAVSAERAVYSIWVLLTVAGWLLASYSAVAVWTNRRKFRNMMPIVIAILMTTQAFFTGLITFVLSPFQV